MNSQTHDIYKNKRALKALETESEQLLKEIEAEPDQEKNILLIRDYNNLQGRVEAAEKLVNPDKRIKAIHISIKKIQRISTKRCGSV